MAWRVVQVLVVPVFFWVLWQAQAFIRADWASAAARQDIGRWVSGAAKPESRRAWDDAHAALLASLRSTPDDPDLQERLGDLFTVAGQRDFADPGLRRRHFMQAAAFYETATRLRPGEAQAWGMLAASYQAAGLDSARVHAAWARALALGPFEGDVQPVLLRIALADWDGASPQMRRWAETLFDEGNPNTRNSIGAMARRFGLEFTADDGLPGRPARDRSAARP